jgi:hypothetical protein
MRSAGIRTLFMVRLLHSVSSWEFVSSFRGNEYVVAASVRRTAVNLGRSLLIVLLSHLQTGST